MEAVLNSGNRGQRAQASESEHQGQREEAAGRSQLATATGERIGSRGIAKYLIEFPPTLSLKKGGRGWKRRNRECWGRDASRGEARA